MFSVHNMFTINLFCICFFCTFVSQKQRKNKNMLKKILVSAPTASAKHYCFEKWIDNVMKFTYPNFQVRLFDNTLDNGESVNFQNELFKKKYGENNDDFLAIHSDSTNSKGLIDRMAKSHNDCRLYAINNDFDYILHLESDVLPPSNVIEQLLSHNKDVCGAVYYRDEGVSRRLMVQQRIYRSAQNIATENATTRYDVNFCDGSLQIAAHIGLGCVLISKKILQTIPFRFVHWSESHGIAMHPDVYFGEDCFTNKIKIYCDTSLICSHDNKNWNLDVYMEGEGGKV